MDAISHNSGPRANMYSASKFTNWSDYDPFFMEARAALKRFDSKLPRGPSHPRIIVLRPHAEFIHPCNRIQIERKLSQVPSSCLEGIRAVFMLAGTIKQLRCHRSSLFCYGCYWRSCVFLHAHPFALRGFDLDSIRDFYLNDVLVHEIGHHVDRFRSANTKTREGFAGWFATHLEKSTSLDGVPRF
jgi:hypothetical protein